MFKDIQYQIILNGFRTEDLMDRDILGFFENNELKTSHENSLPPIVATDTLIAIAEK